MKDEPGLLVIPVLAEDLVQEDHVPLSGVTWTAASSTQ